jgi:Holliday junction resolvase-like predicted endonuclease
MSSRSGHGFPARAAEIRARRARRWMALCVVALAAAVTLAVSPAPQPEFAPVLGIVALLAAVRARRLFSLARRAQIGAGSEQAAFARLEPLQAEGWRVHANVDRPDGGDLDIVAIAPGGPTFVIEIKTSRYTEEHLRRISSAAHLFHAGVAMLATRTRRPTVRERGVTVCSVDDLLWQLRACRSEYRRLLGA